MRERAEGGCYCSAIMNTLSRMIGTQLRFRCQTLGHSGPLIPPIFHNSLDYLKKKIDERENRRIGQRKLVIESEHEKWQK